MAKSKNGGTRAYIRGRIGSDVYSVGKNSKGEKQQVVRSLAETVANPRTSSQMFGRMVMSTVMQAVHAFKPIIDHSFDGFPKGQPSISEFIRRNYALVKADAIAHPASGNTFGLNMYGEKGLKKGVWVLSDGGAQYPTTVQAANGGGALNVIVGSTLTYGALKAAWGMTPEEYVTLICFHEAADFETSGAIVPFFCRLSIKENLADETVLTAENALAAFNLEGDFTPQVRLNEGTISMNGDTSDESTLYGLQWSIVTRKESGSFIHSDLQLTLAGTKAYTSDVALPTYPVGTEMFLNGGDL
jgi:hypothetical protein